MIVRPATDHDLDAYAAIQLREWGEAMAAPRAQLESRLAVFPDGVLVADAGGLVLAGASFIRLASYDVHDRLSWNELTADGWCTNHVPDGQVLYGVDLSVSRRAPRGTSAEVFTAGLELTMRLGVEGLCWGSRLPRYYKYAATMTPGEYVRATTRTGRHLDPELELYSKIPGVEVLGIVPEFFKDWESSDFGAMLWWRNPMLR